MKIAAPLFIALFASACTTSLDTQVLPSPGASGAGAIGMSYALPAREYQFAVTRSLTGCEIKAGQISADFDVKVEAKSTLVDGDWFAVDYRKLGSWSKTSSFEMETYPNQTLKSFNAKADDKSIEIAGGAIKAGFSVAKLAMGLPSADLVGGGPQCPTQKLGQIKQLAGKLKDEAKKLTDLTEELDAYTVTALVGTLSKGDKDEISRLRKAITAQKKTVADIQEKLDELTKAFTFTETVTFLPAANKLDTVLAFPSDKLELRALQMKWITSLFGEEPDDEQLRDIGTSMKPLVVTVRPRSEPGDAVALCKAAGVKPECVAAVQPRWNDFVSSSADARPKAIPGIAYRSPVRATLRICRDGDAKACANDTVSTIVKDDQLIPQLGRLSILPFSNGFGENNELSATFREDGSLEKASYGEKRAVGEALVNALGGALDEGLSLADAIRVKREADEKAKKDAEAAAKNETIATLTRQIDEAKKQKELIELQAALSSNALATSSELAALNARIAQLTAEKTIKELEAKLAE